MRRTATVSRTLRGQAVRLLKEFQLDTDEVFIREVGEKIEFSPRPAYWSRYLDNGPVASADFMDGVEDLLAQERNRY